MDRDSLIESLKKLSRKLEEDPRLWMEIESIFRLNLIEMDTGMSTFGGMFESLMEIAGREAEILRLVDVDRRQFEDFRRMVAENFEKPPQALKLLEYLRAVYGRTLKRVENMARFGPLSWHSTSFSSGPSEEIILEFERADGKRFALQFKGRGNIERFLYSIFESLKRSGFDMREILEKYK